MKVTISAYNACCNLGEGIENIFNNAINGCNNCFTVSDIVKKKVRIGKIETVLPSVNGEDFNLRCNRLILKNFELLKSEINLLLKKYPPSEIGVAVATTNSGVEEFENSHNVIHSELSNPALFIKNALGLKNFYTTVSTACSSGIKAFGIARNLITSGVSKAVIVVGVDSIAKVPLYGFSSLEILTERETNPFSENITGINIGEAVAAFIVEGEPKNGRASSNTGINILGIGETSDTYHSTTPDPMAGEVISAINLALKDANLKPSDIDYINLHGTGTYANDLMEANAISKIFGTKVPVSSTKPLTGHCLGAAASIETALCCYLSEHFTGKLFPHVYDNIYNKNFPAVNLVQKDKIYSNCDICMCNSFGFGGTNAILILGKNNGK